MQCQHCKQYSATIHLTEISNGERVETHLCEKCAQVQGVAIKNQVPLDELLSSLLAAQTDAGSQQSAESGVADSDAAECPSCGMSVPEFKQQGVLGCPNDYEVLDEELTPLITNSQDGKTAHCGKVPAKQPTDSKKQIEVANLNKQLEQAVAGEEYELAAELRDKIEALK